MDHQAYKTKRAMPAGSQPNEGQTPTAAALLRTPIADWPPEALASARELVASPEGLMSLRQASNKKAQVVQFVMMRRLT